MLSDLNESLKSICGKYTQGDFYKVLINHQTFSNYEIREFLVVAKFVTIS